MGEIEARLRAMLEQSTDAIALASVDGEIQYVTPAIERVLGRPPSELVGRSALDWVHRDDVAHARQIVERVLAVPAVPHIDSYRVVHRDGTVRWVDAAVSNLLHVPEVGALVVSFRDSTAHRAAADALRDSEERYRRVVEQSPEPIVVHVDGRIAFANPAAARALGVPRGEDLVGRSIVDLAADDETRSTIRARGLGAPTSPPASLPLSEQRFRREDDGRIVVVEVATSSIVLDGREAALTVARDVTQRKRAEEAAAAAARAADLAQRRLLATLDALPVAVWIADAAGRVVHVNPAASVVYGGHAPAAGSTDEYGVYVATWPATGERLRAEDWALARTLRGGETIVAEPVDIHRFDGSIGHALNSSAPIVDEHGALLGGVAVMLDVTEIAAAQRERDRLLAALDFERRRLGALIQRAPAFIAVLRGPEHVLELANEAYYEHVGRRDLEGRRIADAIPELAEQGFLAKLDAVFRTGQAYVGGTEEIVLRRRAAGPPERSFVKFVYQPLFEEDGTVSGVFFCGTDVTPQVLAAERVRAQFLATPIPTFAWQAAVMDDGSRDVVLVDYNHAAAALAHAVLERALHTPARRFFDAEPEIARDLLEVLETGELRRRELAYDFGGTTGLRRLSVTYAPAPPDRVLAFTEDVTERQLLEQQLRQAQKMEALGRLAGGVAHDFNNLLSVVLSYASFLREDLAPGDPRREDVLEIEKAGKRAVDLTQQLLAFSRRQVLSPRTFVLRDAVADLEKMLRRLIGEDVALRIVASTDASVHADPAQIDQIVLNLAVNARDAMPRGGTLTIEIASVELAAGPSAEQLGVPPGPYAALRVTDTGVGIDPSIRSRLFEPFFTTKSEGKGTGLGLATVFGVATQSGGTVLVHSEPGHGATFEVLLPRVADDGVPRSAAPPSVDYAARGETILLVDDDEQVRRAAHATLARARYRVIEAASAADALLACEQHGAPIDLLLTDVVMPRMSGPELAVRIRQLQPGIRVVFMSGYTGDADVHAAMIEAGDGFVQKPITPELLARAVRDALDAPRER